MRLTTERVKKFKVPNDTDGGYINIRALGPEELATIESTSSESVMSGDGNVAVKMDLVARVAKTAKACLKGWGNLFDEKGKEMKFTQINIRKAAAFEIEIDGSRMRFFAWVEKCHQEFLDEIAIEEGVASEN